MKKWTAYIIQVLLYCTAIYSVSNAASAGPGNMSRQLTVQANEELRKHKFENAYRLVKKAIRLDPSNAEAKSIYMNLYEFIDNPRKRITRRKEAKKRLGNNLPGLQNNPVPGVKTAVEPRAVTPVSNTSERFARFGLIYATGESDYLEYVDSTVKLLGGRAEGGYYFRQTGFGFGLSADYTGYPVKIQGDPRIDFIIHQFNARLSARNDFFTDNGRSSILGVRGGYHFSYMQNKKAEGAYYFRELHGPLVGFFFSEPFFSRFLKNEAIKPMGLEGGINSVLAIKKGKAVWVIEYNIALTYEVKTIRISFGWRSYQVENGEVRERFSGIEAATSYRL